LVFLLLIAGVFWHPSKDVKKAENDVKNLVDASKWAEIHSDFVDGTIKSKLVEDSQYLTDAKSAAKAITRYEELAKKPDEWDKVMVGKTSASDVLKTIGEEAGNQIDSNPILDYRV